MYDMVFGLINDKYELKKKQDPSKTHPTVINENMQWCHALFNNLRTKLFEQFATMIIEQKDICCNLYHKEIEYQKIYPFISKFSCIYNNNKDEVVIKPVKTQGISIVNEDEFINIIHNNVQTELSWRD